MPNVFDQFDTPAAPPQPQLGDAPNVFDQFDPQAPEQPSMVADVAKGIGTGVAKGAASVTGLPGDVQSMSNSLWDRAALGAMHAGFYMTGMGPQYGTPERAQFDQDWNAISDAGKGQSLPTSSGIIGAGQAAVGARLPEPQTTAGKYAESIGEFAPAAIAGPESLGKKLALGAALPGAASEAAGEVTQGTSLEPYARMAGAVGGVGLGAGLSEAAALGAKAASKAGEAFQPMTAAGQAQMAADRLGGATLDLDATRKALATPTADLVPRSKPTTGQLTGDMGILSAEKTAETADPVPFQQRRADQNQARVAAMTGIQPGGAPEDLAAGLRAHLSALDDIEAEKVAGATQAAQDAATGLGGQQSADFYGRGIQSAVQPQIGAAQAGVSDALGRIGGLGTPEQYGSQMRGAAQDAADAAKAQRNALYKAIDPDGTLNAVVTGPRARAQELAKGISPLAAQPAGEEASILGQMQKLPDVAPFRDLQALDTRITAAMSNEARTAGQTPSWGRLTQLKSAVQDAISNGVANQVAYERHGIATGQIAPDASMEARVARWRDEHLARQQQAGLAANSGRIAPTPGAGSIAAPGGLGTASQSRSGPGGASGDQGISPAPLHPNFDQAAADRLAVAKATHAEYARTFKDGPVGSMLKTNGFAGQYKIVDSGVPNIVFQPGAKGGDTLRSYIAATGGNAQADGAVRNYAAMSLRRAAVAPDGSVNLPRYVKWVGDHQDALRAMPNNGMRDFSSIGPAQQSLQKFAPFTSATAPAAIPEMFFHAGPSGADGVANLRQFIGDQAATASLGDYAASRLRQAAMNPDGTLDPRKVAQFTKAHQPALDALPGLADRFSTAAKATDAVNQAALARKSSMDAFQKDAVGKVMGSTEPADITRMVGDVFGKGNSVAQMGDLAAKARAAGPDAIQGLRKAVADHIATRFMSNGEAATSGTNKIAANAFQTFVRKNGPVLGKVFKPEEVSSLQSIADDITRANRSRDAINVPGQSATAQLQHKVAPADHGGGGSWLQSVFFASHGAKEIGHALEHVPLIGEALNAAVGHAAVPVAVARHILRSAQASGLHKVDDLYREALLNPDVAKGLLDKVKPLHGGGEAGVALSTRLMRLAPYFGAQAVPNDTPARAWGGRVGDDEPVAHITGEEIAPKDASLEDLRSAARGYYEANLRNTAVRSVALGAHVHFGSSRKALSSSANPDKLRLFPAVPHVIAEGRRISSRPPLDPKSEPSTRAYHYLQAKVGTPDGHKIVGAMVREDTSGHFYYNHNPLEETGRPRRPSSGPPDKDDVE